jgi:hypothetical protein
VAVEAIRPDLADDSVAIPDAETVLRKLRADWVERDSNGELRVRTAAFGLKGTSVFRLSVASIEEVHAMPVSPELTGVGSLVVAVARTAPCQCRVSPDVQPGDHPAHALILPPMTARNISGACVKRMADAVVVDRDPTSA